MKKILVLGMCLLSTFASASVQDGTYSLSTFYCSNGEELPVSMKNSIEKAKGNSIAVLRVNGKELLFMSNDECGSSRTIYSINDKEASSRAHYVSSVEAQFPGACPNTQNVEDTEGMLIETATSNKIELLPLSIQENDFCSEKLIMVFEK